ncbi:MAG: formylglycine-generating enzyme family protein [bacterium]
MQETPANPAQRARFYIKATGIFFLCLTVGLFFWSQNKHSSSKVPARMVWIPGGTFNMGSSIATDVKHKEEGPAHTVTIRGFWMDDTEVTNAQFQKFIDATGYVTDAEKDLSAKDFPNAPAEFLKGGSLIFKHTKGVDPYQCGTSGDLPWWKFTPGATWQHPEGPQSNINDRMDHPVICLTWKDVHAYTEWAGKRLPSEAEWEFAARGGLKDKPYVWGDEENPNGKYMANYWQGNFPAVDTGKDGFIQVAPVKSFPANDYGLYDMSGNVWEMCEDWYRPDFYKVSSSDNPRGPALGYDPEKTGFGEHVIRGGSWLCDEGYCFRYRPSARQGLDTLTSTNHVGFRCAADGPVPNKK